MWKNEACITKQTHDFHLQLQMFIQIPSNMDKEIFFCSFEESRAVSIKDFNL